MREKSEQTTPLSDSKTKKALVALFIFDEFQCIAVIIEWSRLTNGAHFPLYTANSHIFTLSLHSTEMLVKFFAFGVHFSLNRLQLEMCRNLRELSKEIYVLHLHFHCHYNALENRFLPFFFSSRSLLSKWTKWMCSHMNERWLNLSTDFIVDNLISSSEDATLCFITCNINVSTHYFCCLLFYGCRLPCCR